MLRSPRNRSCPFSRDFRRCDENEMTAIYGEQWNLFDGWATDSDVKQLTKKTNGLFIFAATVVKIIASAGRGPKRALRSLIQDDSTAQ